MSHSSSRICASGGHDASSRSLPLRCVAASTLLAAQRARLHADERFKLECRERVPNGAVGQCAAPFDQIGREEAKIRVIDV